MSTLITENLGKGYRIYRKPSDSLKELLLRRTYHRTFWALQGVTFRCEQGESIGIIGANGAGKSTLLKLLAGTMQPSEGVLTIEGRVSAILELGTGFHPEFSGLDNIRMGCAMLGLNAAETRDRIPEIIAFSELEAFIEQPVKSYSSGMYVRLAFAIVTCIEPELLVVDEALSVGDQHFQKKSINRMNHFRQLGKSLIFCSHNLYHVKELCSRALWLHQGKVAASGEVGEVVDAYQDFVRQKDRLTIATAPPTTTGKDQESDLTTLPQLLNVTLDRPGELPLYRSGDPFCVSVSAHRGTITMEDIHVGIVITRNDGVQCYGVSTAVDKISLTAGTDGCFSVRYQIDALPLLSGEYFLEVWYIDATSVHIYDSRNPCCPFKVRQKSVEVGMVWLPHRWEQD
ncbi:MAG: ABC transporter ATP-binding protein [Gammaproteobacteria bacterium]|nr:ABC transporter ATP-binding protein [Gammaproteobacteria bacterium]